MAPFFKEKQMFFYVDTKEMRETPKKGVQWVAWFNRSSANNRQGVPHVEVIQGEECQLRALSEEALAEFLKTTYHRQPHIKPVLIVEDLSGE